MAFSYTKEHVLLIVLADIIRIILINNVHYAIQPAYNVKMEHLKTASHANLLLSST